MPRFGRAPGELLVKLEHQLSALHSSSKAFDAGDHWEAERIAATLYILLHDGGKRTRALFTQLGIKRKIEFLSSSRGMNGEYMPPFGSKGEAIPPTPLVTFVAEGLGPFKCLPTLDALEGDVMTRYLPFSKWYDEPIYKNGKGQVLSRKNLIFSLRSQDGGSHIDPKLTDESYVSLKTDPDGRVRVNGLPIENAHFATMRQIAWEVEKSLANARALGTIEPRKRPSDS